MAARNEAAAAEYASRLKEHARAIEQAKASEEAEAAKHAAKVAQAAAEKRDHERRLADHAAKVAANEAAAKAKGKGLYRGFIGKDCEHARRVAVSKGSFEEAAHEIKPSGRIVQGWWVPKRRRGTDLIINDRNGSVVAGNGWKPDTASWFPESPRPSGGQPGALFP